MHCTISWLRDCYYFIYIVATQCMCLPSILDNRFLQICFNFGKKRSGEKIKLDRKTQGCLIFIFSRTTFSALSYLSCFPPHPHLYIAHSSLLHCFASGCVVSYFKRIRCRNKLCSEGMIGSPVSIVYLWSLCVY